MLPGPRLGGTLLPGLRLPGLRLGGRHDRAGEPGAIEVLGGLLPGPRLRPGPFLRLWPGGRRGVLFPGLWLDGWHVAGLPPGARLGPGPSRRPGAHGRPGVILFPGLLGSRRCGAGVFCAPGPGQSRGRLRGGNRGDGEGPGDVRGHLAKLGRQPDGARPELVGLPGGGFADRLGLLGRLPPYLLGLLLRPAQRVGLESSLPPDFFGFLLGGCTDRVGVVQRLLLYPGRLAVGVREDPLRQPDGVSIPEGTGIPPDGVEQLGRVFHRELGHLPRVRPDTRWEVLVGGGDENLDPALTEGDLVIRRLRQASAPRAGPLLRTHLFPPMLTQMVRVGEETGTLDTYLEQAADFYEEELDYRIRAMTSLIEPVMTVAVGLVVGFIAVSLISAMYGLVGALK